jgi:hypothetical protein
VGDELVIAVDAAAVGLHEGVVNVDSDGGSATIRVRQRNTMDFTAAFCDHSGAGTGPGGAGAFGHPGEGTWWKATSLGSALAAGAFPFFDTSKTYSAYYVLDFFPGSGPDDFIAVVPAVFGHYSSPSWLPPGAQFQTQVAP